MREYRVIQAGGAGNLSEQIKTAAKDGWRLP
jgi:hypothetical protein